MFRQTVRSFVERDVAPHIEAWEAAGRISKSIWPRMGALGLLGVEYDEKYGGGGADLLTTAVLHEECARSRSGSFAMAVGDRKSTRLNSSHDQNSYAVFCLKQKKRK